MNSEVRTLIEQIVGPQFVHEINMPTVVHLAGRGPFKRFDEQKKLALLGEFRRLYAQMYLSLDPVDEDILKDVSGHWELIGRAFYLIYQEQNVVLLHQQLYRGNWLLLFGNQAISRDFRVPEGYGQPSVMQQLLLQTGAQFAIASGPDDTEWTVGWRTDEA